MAKRNVEILAGGGRYLLVAASTGIVVSGFEMGHGSKKGADVSFDVPNGMLVVSNPDIGIARGRRALTLNLSDDDRKKIEDSIDSFKGKSVAKAAKVVEDIDKATDESSAENAAMIAEDLARREVPGEESD